MKGLQMILKAIGLDLTPENLAMLQAVITQLPAKINEAGAAINAALQNFDMRLKAIEASQQALELLIVELGHRVDVLQGFTRSSAVSTADAMQKILEQGGTPNGLARTSGEVQRPSDGNGDNAGTDTGAGSNSGSSARTAGRSRAGR